VTDSKDNTVKLLCLQLQACVTEGTQSLPVLRSALTTGSEAHYSNYIPFIWSRPRPTCKLKNGTKQSSLENSLIADVYYDSNQLVHFATLTAFFQKRRTESVYTVINIEQQQ
jgi:hypothetical protein